MRAILALLLTIWLAPAFAQVPMTGAGKGAPGAAGYQGPGDVFSGAILWGSCSRVYTAAQASTATSLCDLVQTDGSTVVCTLRGSSTGYVDLTNTYCGGDTPSNRCTTVGGCQIKQVYDQTGNSRHWTNTTAAQQPTLTFSAANGLPGITVASGTRFMDSPTFANSQPYSLVTVYKRTSGTSLGGVVGSNSGVTIGPSAANTAVINGSGGDVCSMSATDGSFHALQGINNGTSSILNVDGTDSSTCTQTTTWTAGVAARIMRGSGCCNLTGIVMEAGIWGSTSASSSALNTNMHTAYSF